MEKPARHGVLHAKEGKAVLKPGILVLILFLARPAAADFSFFQSTRITAGNMTLWVGPSKPVEETFAIKGQRLVQFSDKEARVIDFQQGTVVSINFEDKKYLRANLYGVPPPRGHSAHQENARPELTVKDTGRTKQIEGYMTFETEAQLRVLESERSGRQLQLTLIGQIWLAPDVPGYQQARKRFVEILAKRKAMLSRTQTIDAATGLITLELLTRGLPVYGVTRLYRQPLPHNAGSNKPEAFEPPEFPWWNPSGAPGLVSETITELKSFRAGPVDSKLFEIPAGFKGLE